MRPTFLLLACLIAFPAGAEPAITFNAPSAVSYMHSSSGPTATQALTEGDAILTPHEEESALRFYDEICHRTATTAGPDSAVQYALFAADALGRPDTKIGESALLDATAAGDHCATFDDPTEWTVIDSSYFYGGDLALLEGDLVWVGWVRSGGGQVSSYALPPSTRRELARQVSGPGNAHTGSVGFSGFLIDPGAISAWTSWADYNNISAIVADYTGNVAEVTLTVAQ